ncbi:unnamed protein product [Ectocarpus sp. CCAP 1310/34]|nr:unnamed protein product [Ectocarpus sp. CCAP 1310/34]
MSSVSTSADPLSESSSVAVGVVRTRAEAAAAAAPPPPPQSPERAAGAVEIVGAGGSGADVPVITAAAVYNKDGEPHAVNTAVVKAVDDFKVPEGYVRKGSREKSYMYSLGVYIEALKGDKHQFYCLVDGTCRRKNKMIPCKGGDRSNVNSHLKNAHGLQGVGGVVKEGKKKAAKENIAANLAAKENSGVGTDRLRGYPLDHRSDVVGNMQEEINKAPLPIIHYGLDLWTCKVSGRKYLGVHVFYVDSNFSLRHALISVKHYAPSTEIQGTEKASEILFTIFRATLAEYGIKLSDLAGGTTDSGSDVKAMCVNILLGLHKIWWDWCDCHLADKSAENTFGTSADPQQSKNKIARDVIKLVIKTAAKINQSTIVKQKFEKVTLEMLDEILKITKHAPQRWLSLVLVMERIIRLWHVLRKVYANDGEEFPLDKGNNRDDILQLYSLLQPLSAITRDGQYGNAPMTAEMHLAFAQLKM